jgi:hypothetical protein
MQKACRTATRVIVMVTLPAGLAVRPAVWPLVRPLVWPVEPPLLAVDLMEMQGLIQPTPQVVVSYGHHLPKKLPTPAVIPPLRQSQFHTAAHILPATNQRHARRLVQRFESANHGQQSQAVPVNVRFDVGHSEQLGSVRLANLKRPAPRSFGPIGLGKQQEIWHWSIHRGVSVCYYGDFGKGSKTGKGRSPIRYNPRRRPLLHSVEYRAKAAIVLISSAFTPQTPQFISSIKVHKGADRQFARRSAPGAMYLATTFTLS